MESQLQDALGRVADGEWWQEEAERLAGELERGRKTLNAALESVEIMKSDKLELGEQIADLVRRFKSAESSLVQTSHELETVTKALESTSAELMRRSEAHRAERKSLIRNALDSLQQLRQHLTFTLSGLRVVQSQGEKKTLPWKHSAGIVSPRGDAMVVSFVPPPHETLDRPSALPQLPPELREPARSTRRCPPRSTGTQTCPQTRYGQLLI